MVEVHFSQRTLERFLRAELSRRDNAEVVRHLLGKCPICQDTMQAAALRQGFRVGEPVFAPLPLAASMG